MNARTTVNRHGNYVLAGNFQAAMAEFMPEARETFVNRGVFPPQGTTSFEVLNEQQDGDRTQFVIRWSNGNEVVTLGSTWVKLGHDWKIIDTKAL